MSVCTSLELLKSVLLNVIGMTSTCTYLKQFDLYSQMTLIPYILLKLAITAKLTSEITQGMVFTSK